MAQMMIRIIGKHAFKKPSTTDHKVMPKIDTPAYFSGTIPIAGTANRANKIVTAKVMMALL
jgi:hypothetical protein